MKVVIVAAFAGALAGAVPSVSAGPVGNEVGPNLVSNGGFELGLAGWSTSGFQLQDYDFGVDGSFAHAEATRSRGARSNRSAFCRKV